MIDFYKIAEHIAIRCYDPMPHEERVGEIKNALRSVAKQTAIEAIREILFNWDSREYADNNPKQASRTAKMLLNQFDLTEEDLK